MRPTKSRSTASAGDADGAARASTLSTGVEHVEVDPRRGDDDPVGVGVVEVDELARLATGVGDESVGGLDDLGLTDLAAIGSGRSPSARWRFLTRAIVCMVCTSGTPQRSAASQPTCPESQ